MKILKWFKKNENESIMKYKELILVLIGGTLALNGLMIIILGFHNFDLAQNWEEVNYLMVIYAMDNNLNTTLEIWETTMGGDIITNFDDMYRKGLTTAVKGLFFYGLGLSLFFIGLTLYQVKKEEKE